MKSNFLIFSRYFLIYTWKIFKLRTNNKGKCKYTLNEGQVWYGTDHKDTKVLIFVIDKSHISIFVGCFNFPSLLVYCYWRSTKIFHFISIWYYYVSISFRVLHNKNFGSSGFVFVFRLMLPTYIGKIAYRIC